MDKNSKEYESLQAKLKKLLALAEQGVGGAYGGGYCTHTQGACYESGNER